MHRRQVPDQVLQPVLARSDGLLKLLVSQRCQTLFQSPNHQLP